MPKNIIRGFLSILSGSIGVTAVSIVLTPILVRVLGVSGYGSYAAVLSIIAILSILFNAGIFDATRKFISEDSNNRGWASNVFAYYLRLSTVVVALGVISLLLITFLGLPEELFGEGFTGYFYLILLVLVFKQMYQVFRSGLMGLGFEHYTESLHFARQVLFGLLAIPLAVWIGVDGALLAYAIAYGAAGVVLVVILNKYINLKYICDLSKEKLPTNKLLGYNLMSMILILFIYSLYHIDIILIQYFLDNESTGYYRAALTVAEFMWFVPLALQTVLLHSTSELWSKNKMDEITNLTSNAVQFALFLTIIMGVGVIVLARPFINIYFGPEFATAIVPLYILIPGTIGFAIARPILAVSQSSGQLRLLILVTGIASVINILLNIALVPRYNIIGAAVATSIGYASMLLGHYIIALKMGYQPFYSIRILRLLASGILTAPILFAIEFLIESNVLSLVIIPFIGIIIYLFLCLNINAINQSDIDLVLTQLPDHICQKIKIIMKKLVLVNKYEKLQ